MKTVLGTRRTLGSASGDDARFSLRVSRRTWLACVAAALGLGAAAVAAIGPAHEYRATYDWPPSSIPHLRPAKGWYSPLPLLNRVPESLVVRLPCGLSPGIAEPAAGTVLATARKTETPALRIAEGGGELLIAAGSNVRVHVPWPSACPLVIQVVHGDLRIGDSVVPLRLPTLDDMPVVTGLFTTLDLNRGHAPRVLVRTRPFRMTFTLWQTVAAGLAIGLALAALVFGTGMRLRGRSPVAFIRRAWRARHVTDVIVFLTVLVWWVVAPIFTDDGWVAAEARAFRSFGDINVLYDVWGLTSPVGRWIASLTHWIVGSTSDLIVMRIPSLAAILVAWALVRWCFHIAVGGRTPSSARWALLGAFLAGTAAWEMTIRPEPFISLLVLWALAGTLSFVRRPCAAALALTAPPIVLAVTAHPAGFLAVAPALAGAPTIVRWLRAGGRNAVAELAMIALAAVAIGLVVFVFEADLGSRLASGHIFQEADRHNVPPWREYLRYELFDQYGGGNVGRRLSLALLLIAALAWLFRVRRRIESVLAEPARAVAIGLALLALVSSKWPWHFGTLAPLGAVAIGCESARLSRASAALVRIGISSAVVAAAVIWAWEAPDGWSPLDLQQLEWTDGFNTWSLAAVFLLAAAGAVCWLRRRTLGPAALSGFPGAIVGFASIAVVGVTVTILMVDAVRSPWSPARQNLEALYGRRTNCGLASQLHGDPRIAKQLAGPMATLLAPAVAPYLPCATPPKIRGGVLDAPAFFAYQGDPWPITEPAAPYAALADLYRLKTVARGPQKVAVEVVDFQIPGFRRLDPARIDGKRFAKLHRDGSAR